MYRCAPNCATFHLISNFVLSRLGLLAYCDIPLSHRQHVLDNAWADPSVAFITRTALSHRLLHAPGGYLNSKTFCHHHSPHTQRRSNMSRSMDLFRRACNFVMVRRLVREQRDHSVDRQPPQLLLKSDPAIPDGSAIAHSPSLSPSSSPSTNVFDAPPPRAVTPSCGARVCILRPFSSSSCPCYGIATTVSRKDDVLSPS